MNDQAEFCIFTLAMVAEFGAPLQDAQWRYRQLHCEAACWDKYSTLGAEAAGLRGTGIGCYFDDDCHELLGLQLHGTTSPSLYHFTVGYQLVDVHRRYPDHLALLEGAESAP